MKKITLLLMATILLIGTTACAGSKSNIADSKVGSVVSLGKYEQDNDTQNGEEDIDWVVISSNEDGITLMSKYCIESKPYNDAEIGAQTSWTDCSIRKWLNHDFYESAFEDEEKALLTSFNYEGTDDKVILINEEIINEVWPDYGIKTVEMTFNESNQGIMMKTTSDKDYEPLMAKYTEYAKEVAISSGSYTDYESIEKESGENACFWWTSISGADSSHVVEVFPTGGAIEAPAKSAIGIRPIIRLSK